MCPRQVDCASPVAARGTVLVVGLILLAIMSLLALGGMRGTGIQARMASNLRDRNLAFQFAEAALREAEQRLAAGEPAALAAAVAPTADSGDAHRCWGEPGSETAECPLLLQYPARGADGQARFDPADWGLSGPAAYRIERLRASNRGSLAADEAISSAPMYRITVRAVGGTADSVVILQSTYRP